MYYAVRLVRATKYNSIWILFIIGFMVLAAERLLQLCMSYGYPIPMDMVIWFDIVISICVSVGMVMLDRLFDYIERLNRHRQMTDKRILTAVLRTEERTRANFSKELHDGLGPLLSSAKMSLSALPHDTLPADQREILKNTTFVIEEAICSVREISNNLSPQVLNDFGLAQGIKNFISRSITLHSVPIRFSTNLRAERFDNDVEVIVYRVICELINNSLKHSGCSSITLSLQYDQYSLCLVYSDNGRGFSPEAVVDCGMGLSNISSRVSSLNGTFDIASRKGHGMKTSITIPISDRPTK
jgi:signal transduction histidine kinase